MSSAFNNQALPSNEKLPSVNEDTTLKWRGLLHNTYASKSDKDSLGREMRKRSSSVKEKATDIVASDTVESNASDLQQNTLAIEKTSEMSETKSSMVIDTPTTTTSTKNSMAADNNGTSALPTDKPTTVDKKSSTRLTRSKPLLDKSDRSLRSNRTNNGVVSEAPPTISTTRRGRKKREEKSPLKPSSPRPSNTQQSTVESENVTKQEKPRLILTIRPKTAIVAINPETSPKRRGRKPKQSQSKRTEDQKILNVRPVRRIKPTQKILDSDELREGFVQQNCARLNITNEEIKNLEEVIFKNNLNISPFYEFKIFFRFLVRKKLKKNVDKHVE